MRPTSRFDATGYILLTLDAPVLTAVDALYEEEEQVQLSQRIPDALRPHWNHKRPLLLLDSTWNYVAQLQRVVVGKPLPRSLPTQIKTAYPRLSKVKENPVAGLASVEALYAASHLLDAEDPTLLKHYHWAEAFREQPFFKKKLNKG